jgi:hypothetical protein
MRLLPREVARRLTGAVRHLSAGLIDRSYATLAWSMVLIYRR